MDSIEKPLRDLLLRGSVISASLGGKGTGRRVDGGGLGRLSKGEGGK